MYGSTQKIVGPKGVFRKVFIEVHPRPQRKEVLAALAALQKRGNS